MDWKELLEIFEHTFLDSLFTWFIVFIMYLIISFFEKYLARLLRKQNKFSPLFGAIAGCAPQCGVPIVATDLYMRRHITMGTLVATYIACSDEAIPIMLSDMNKAIAVLPLILCKIAIAFFVGFFVDTVVTKKININTDENPEGELSACHCTHHHFKNTRLQRHLIDPFFHSIKIFIYILVVNLILHTLIHIIGTDKLGIFLESNKYITPIISTIIGMIPNCASSMVITEIYMLGGISFGACLGGLCINAGIGIVFLLRDRKFLKEALIIISILFITSILVGYTICLFTGF